MGDDYKVRTVFLSQLAGGAKPSVVYGLEDLLVQLLRLRAVERQAQQDEGVRQTLQQESTKPSAGINLSAIYALPAPL